MERSARPIDDAQCEHLSDLARQVRRDSVDVIYHAGSGSPGSTLSCVDAMVWLYHHEMRINKSDCRWDERDRFILSKGQASPAYYSIFCQLGWLEHADLSGYRNFGTKLQTHPEYDAIDAIDFPSGSLGMGLSAANGMALAGRLKGLTDPRYFVMMGDGEMQEGQVWEAAMTAGHYGLGEVVLIIDRNVFQGDRSVDDVMKLDPLGEKWRSFGWDVAEADGHDFKSLSNALASLDPEKPKVLISSTLKGKGVSFMEGDNLWHTGGPKFTKDIYDRAISDLGGEQ